MNTTKHTPTAAPCGVNLDPSVVQTVGILQDGFGEAILRCIDRFEQDLYSRAECDPDNAAYYMQTLCSLRNVRTTVRLLIGQVSLDDTDFISAGFHG